MQQWGGAVRLCWLQAGGCTFQAVAQIASAPLCVLLTSLMPLVNWSMSDRMVSNPCISSNHSVDPENIGPGVGKPPWCQQACVGFVCKTCHSFIAGPRGCTALLQMCMQVLLPAPLRVQPPCPTAFKVKQLVFNTAHPLSPPPFPLTSLVCASSMSGVSSRASAVMTLTLSSQCLGGSVASWMSKPNTRPPFSRGPSCWQDTCARTYNIRQESTTVGKGM
jgi:hypothetical protein